MSATRVLPWALHVTLEYLAGIFLVLSPFLFGFTDSVALPVLLGAGVVILAVAVLSRGRVGIVGFLPVKVQAAFDYLLAFFLMVAPFVFGYQQDADALLISVMTGLGLLVVSLLTRYPQPAPATAGDPTATPEEPAAGTLTDTGTDTGEPARPALASPDAADRTRDGGRSDDLGVPERTEDTRDRDTEDERAGDRPPRRQAPPPGP